MKPLPCLCRLLILLFPLHLLYAADFVPSDEIVSDPDSDLPDPEFDTVFNQMVWQSESGELWTAKVDPATGRIIPEDGRGVLLDNNLTSFYITGNGPEWAFGKGREYIAYTKNVGTDTALGVARRLADGNWRAALLFQGGGRWKPEGAAASNKDAARIVYNYDLSPDETVVAWRNIDYAQSEDWVGGVAAQGGRWIEGERAYLTITEVTDTLQFFRSDIDDKPLTLQQITFDNATKVNPYSWFAPEFNAPLFSAIINLTRVGIYRETQPGIWSLIHVLRFPSEYPFISSPEAFVHNGKSYIVTILASQLNGSGTFPFQPVGPSQVWIAGIDPAEPFFRRVDEASRSVQRSEPEMFTTARGPEVFYTEKAQVNNIRLLRRADTGLGPEWGYDKPRYSGPWAAIARDNRNSGSTPFPVAAHYREDTVRSSPSRQTLRPLLGPAGKLYLPSLVNAGGRATAVVSGFDLATGAELFRLAKADLSGDFLNAGGLVDADGHLYLAGNAQLGKFTADGVPLWQSPVRGTPRALQFGPGGEVILFTYNGWFHAVAAATGQALTSVDLTPGRVYPGSLERCFEAGNEQYCAFQSAPAVDYEKGLIYVTYRTATGVSQLRTYRYDTELQLLSVSGALAGEVSAPVLSADYKSLYVQTSQGALMALNTPTLQRRWRFDLGFEGPPATPVVTYFDYILPGGSVANAPAFNYVGVLQDTGNQAVWAYRNFDYAPVSLGAAGRGNTFVLAARRLSDDRIVLLTLHPFYGITSVTPWVEGELPDGFTGVVVREDGTIVLGARTDMAYKLYAPVYQ